MWALSWMWMGLLGCQPEPVSDPYPVDPVGTWETEATFVDDDGVEWKNSLEAAEDGEATAELFSHDEVDGTLQSTDWTGDWVLEDDIATFTLDAGSSTLILTCEFVHPGMVCDSEPRYYGADTETYFRWRQP